MGAATDRYVQCTDLDRADQDAFAARSHELAVAATEDGTFDDEIVPVEIKSRRGTTTISADEGIRSGTTTESLGKLQPAFLNDGTITAGSASQLSDGAAAVVLMSKATAEGLGLEWLAELGASAFVAGPDTSLLYQPASAIAKAVEKDGGLKVSDLDVAGSTRPSPASPLRRYVNWASTPTKSTSTAEPLHSDTLSACPAHGSHCRLHTR